MQTQKENHKFSLEELLTIQLTESLPNENFFAYDGESKELLLTEAAIKTSTILHSSPPQRDENEEYASFRPDSNIAPEIKDYLQHRPNKNRYLRLGEFAGAGHETYSSKEALWKLRIAELLAENDPSLLFYIQTKASELEVSFIQGRTLYERATKELGNLSKTYPQSSLTIFLDLIIRAQLLLNHPGQPRYFNSYEFTPTPEERQRALAFFIFCPHYFIGDGGEVKNDKTKSSDKSSLQYYMEKLAELMDADDMPIEKNDFAKLSILFETYLRKIQAEIHVEGTKTNNEEIKSKEGDQRGNRALRWLSSIFFFIAEKLSRYPEKMKQPRQ
jgi:hypothetical protein